MKTMALAFVLILVGPVTAIGQPQYFWETQHYYEWVAEPADWFTASADAQSRTLYGVNGHLATISYEGENAFVANAFETNSAYYAWIGASQALGSPEPNYGWGWVTGEAWAYLNWAPGEPNNYYIDQYGYEDGLAMVMVEDNEWPLGCWNDWSRAYHAPYIIEYDTPEPATLALLALGGLAVIGRRQQHNR